MVCQPAMSKVKPPPRRLCRNGLEVRREQTNGFQSFRTRSIIKFTGKCPWCSKRSLFILLEPLNPNAWRFRSKAFSSARPFPFWEDFEKNFTIYIWISSAVLFSRRRHPLFPFLWGRSHQWRPGLLFPVPTEPEWLQGDSLWRRRCCKLPGTSWLRWGY